MLSQGALPHIKTEQRGAVLWAFLDRPKKRNAIDGTLARSLQTLFAARLPKTTRAVVLASTTPGVFCAGGDLRWMATAPRRELGAVWDALRAVQTCAVPVVARVDGVAAGGGAGLLAACDVALTATPAARVALREVRVGLVPAMVSGFVLGRAGGGAPTAALTRMFLAGEALDGPAACRAGLTAAHYATGAELDAAIAAFCAALARCSPAAVAHSKRLLVAAHDRAIAGGPRGVRRLRAQLVRELDAARRTRDGREGIAAFLEKRPPVWSFDE